MKNTVSPKVWAQLVATLVLGSLVAGIGAVTPGMLAALGPWAPVVFAAVTALGGGLAGYMVTDPDRLGLLPPPDQGSVVMVRDHGPSGVAPDAESVIVDPPGGL